MKENPMITRVGLCLLAGLVLALSGAAQAQDAAGLKIEGTWARASAGMARNGAAYITIHNEGPAADRLIAASSPVAGTIELHAHLEDGDVMSMGPVVAAEIAPCEPAVPQPGGLHVMMLGLKTP